MDNAIVYTKPELNLKSSYTVDTQRCIKCDQEKQLEFLNIFQRYPLITFICDKCAEGEDLYED